MIRPAAGNERETSDSVCRGSQLASHATPTPTRLAGYLASGLFVAAAASGCGGDAELTTGETKATFQLDPLSPQKPDFTTSTIDISEPGKEVEIVSLRPLGTPNVAYLGAITVWPRDADSAAEADLGFPGEGIRRYHQAIGSVIPASETAFKHAGQTSPAPLWVGAGFRLTSGNVGGIFDIEVTYRVDGEERRARSGKVFLVCKAPCEGDKYNDVEEWGDAMRKDLGIEEVRTSG